MKSTRERFSENGGESSRKKRGSTQSLYAQNNENGRTPRPDIKRKLVVVGDGGMSSTASGANVMLISIGCGKTCLLTVYAERRFPEVRL